jgi:hypothetical protein
VWKVILVTFEVFTAVTMKNAVLWNVTPRGSCKNRNFTANVPTSLILVTLMTEPLRSSETSFLQEPHGIISEKTAFVKVILVVGITRIPKQWVQRGKRP